MAHESFPNPLPETFGLRPLTAFGAPWHYLADYPERCWLPLVGPSTYLCWRLLNIWTEETLEVVYSDDLAGCLGLAPKASFYGPLSRTLRRLHSFSLGVVNPDADGRWFVGVRPALPFVPPHLALRLRGSAEDHHHEALAHARSLEAADPGFYTLRRP